MHLPDAWYERMQLVVTVSSLKPRPVIGSVADSWTVQCFGLAVNKP